STHRVAPRLRGLRISIRHGGFARGPAGAWGGAFGAGRPYLDGALSGAPSARTARRASGAGSGGGGGAADSEDLAGAAAAPAVRPQPGQRLAHAALAGQ
ncbi:unnamed protein product, partial [Effrenium voratum]